MNIVSWNCQGLRLKRKELQNYLLENQIDILALNETFLKPKFKFHLPGYDIYKNDRLAGTKGGVPILVKKGIIVNQEWKNEHFNVITDNEAFAIKIELQNGDKIILATICPNGNPSLRQVNRSSKNVFENILKTTVSLVNTSQALGNPSQQLTIFSVSPRPSWKASIGENM